MLRLSWHPSILSSWPEIKEPPLGSPISGLAIPSEVGLRPKQDPTPFPLKTARCAPAHRRQNAHTKAHWCGKWGKKRNHTGPVQHHGHTTYAQPCPRKARKWGVGMPPAQPKSPHARAKRVGMPPKSTGRATRRLPVRWTDANALVDKPPVAPQSAAPAFLRALRALPHLRVECLCVVRSSNGQVGDLSHHEETGRRPIPP